MRGEECRGRAAGSRLACDSGDPADNSAGESDAALYVRDRQASESATGKCGKCNAAGTFLPEEATHGVEDGSRR